MSQTLLAEEFAQAGMNENAARIMAAALDLFADKGYAATSVREIVQRAEVTNPMLYYYFESKEGVFKALFEFLFQSMEEEVGEILDDETTSLQAKLRRVARAHLDACRDEPQILRFIYSVLFGPRRSSPDFDVVCSYESIQERLEATLSEAIETGEFSPRPDFDALFVTERFLGLVNNHLMGVLTLYDTVEDDDERQTMLVEFLGEQALDRMLEFFFLGAGQVSKETS